ncbi:tetratricopeptide repeat protein [Thalassotalea sp. ND16A]|uniref:tetratricopeptide repeat protein n=1 Tax=Thalassotalea sp. ND16A TaxID=1535422 RepID=UPI000519FBB3|nr:hypothetical protein [Thalassotalea sp. ND16A]KGK01525.1 hypothetical protein ND16A_2979 [Thalassotalea sp. ND16A]
MTKKFLLLISVYFACFCVSGQQPPKSIDALKQHLAAKQYQTAFALAEDLADDLAGDVEFDFLAGLAAYGAQQYQAAVFSFERVVILRPSSFYGRYYLALSYRKVNNLAAAKVELKKLQTATAIIPALSAEQKSKVEQQLKRTEQQLRAEQRRWNHDLMLTLGSDDNINSGSSLNAIELPDGSLIELFESSKATDDEGYAARFHSNYRYPIDQNKSLIFDLSLQYRNYSSHSEYKRQNLDFSAKYQQQLLNETSFYLGLSTAPLWFSGEKYWDQHALLAGWQQALDSNSGYGVNAAIAEIDHLIFDNLDLTRYQVNAYYHYQTSVHQLFILNGYLDDNKDGLKYNDKTVLAGSYVLSYPIYHDVTGSTMLMYEQQQHDARHPLFNAYSDSSLALISTKINYNGFDQQLLQLELSYQEKNVESKLEAMKLYEYERFEANVKWQYRF